MNDIEMQQRFIQARSQGHSFARIAQNLGVSKPTLIKWSRKFRFEIQNLRAIERENLCDALISNAEQRARKLGDQLKAVEAELAKRDLSELSTSRLFSLADNLRQQVLRETGSMRFTTPLKEIPNDEYHEQVQDWNP
jgi:transposase-like protein